MKMKKPLKKLSELPNETEIASDSNHSLSYTVDEVKSEIGDGFPHHIDSWFIIKRQKWKSNADLMICRYLEDEGEDMYDGWYEKAKSNISDDAIKKIQSILDGELNKPSITDCWTLEEEVDIDIFPVEEVE